MTGFSLQESLDFISYWLSKNDCNGICKYRLGIKNTKKPSMHVLLPSIFYYFGRNAIILPSRLSHIIPEPGTRPHKRFSEKEAREFERWIKSNYTVGIHGDPCDFRQKYS